MLVTPFRRLASASLQPPPVHALAWSLPIALALWPRRAVHLRWIATGLAVVWFGAVLVSSGVSDVAYQAGWLAGWGIPVLAAVAAVLLAVTTPADERAERQRSIALTLSIVAVCYLLVEFPFAAAIYTLYALPIAMLALACVVRAFGRTSPYDQVIVALFFLLFGYVRVNPGNLVSLGQQFTPREETIPLSLSRATLHMPPEEAVEFDSLIPFVQGKAGGASCGRDQTHQRSIS